MSMRVLVTGGCGFIGSHVCERLQNEGHEVLAVDNLSAGKRENVSCPIAVEDITDGPAMERTLTEFRPRVVVHLAAHTRVRESLENPLNNAEQNISGTISILQACRGRGVEKFIYTSTGGARYGDPERLPVSETDPLRPISPYGISKYAAEHYVRVLSDMHGFDYLILCFGNVYGPRSDPVSTMAIPIFATRMLRGEPPQIFGDGGQTRDFLYVEDIARVVFEQLDTRTRDKLFNLASGTQTSVNEVCRLMEEEYRTGLKPEHVDPIRGEVRDIVLDISRAREQLAFEPTPFAEGLRKTLAWFREVQPAR